MSIVETSRGKWGWRRRRGKDHGVGSLTEGLVLASKVIGKPSEDYNKGGSLIPFERPFLVQCRGEQSLWCSTGEYEK